MKLSIRASIIFSTVLLFSPSLTPAATVTSGALTMNLDRDALATLVLNPSGTPPTLFLEEFFTSPSLTGAQINDVVNTNLVPGNGEIPATGLVYNVTGSTVTNPAGRAIQATNFTYDPSNLTGTATGQIGLGGVLRFMGNFGGIFATGDYALKYDATRVGNAAGGSGWYLLNNYGFPVPGWDLTDVTASSDPFSLSLSGTLKWSPEVTNAFFHSSDIGKSMGTFTFVSPVPLPAAAWLFGSGNWIGRTRTAPDDTSWVVL
ncbi:MAG: hypothetical protein U0361_23525 [Nitrospiraceae bacterium]